MLAKDAKSIQISIYFHQMNYVNILEYNLLRDWLLLQTSIWSLKGRERMISMEMTSSTDVLAQMQHVVTKTSDDFFRYRIQGYVHLHLQPVPTSKSTHFWAGSKELASTRGGLVKLSQLMSKPLDSKAATHWNLESYTKKKVTDFNAMLFVFQVMFTLLFFAMKILLKIHRSGSISTSCQINVSIWQHGG